MSNTLFNNMVQDNVLNMVIRAEDSINGIRSGGIINNLMAKVKVEAPSPIRLVRGEKLRLV